MRMNLKVDDRIHPIAPTIQSLAHRKHRLDRPIIEIRKPVLQKVIVRLVLDRKRHQRPKQQRRQGIIILRKAIETLKQPMQFLFLDVPENLQKTALSLAGLHAPLFRVFPLRVIAGGLDQQLIEPGMDHQGVEVRIVRLLPTEGNLAKRFQKCPGAALFNCGHKCPVFVPSVIWPRPLLAYCPHGQCQGCRLPRGLVS